MRILLAGIVGGLLMFVWGFVSHAVLELTDKHFGALPASAAALPPGTDSGLFRSPGRPDVSTMSAGEARAATESWQAAFMAGPSAIVVHRQAGDMPSMAILFGRQIACCVLLAMILAFIVSRAAGLGYGSKVLICTLAGVASWLASSVPYWNWYGFPGGFAVAEGIDRVVEFTVAGLVVAKIVRAR